MTSLRRATAVMTFGTVLSRLTGLLRLAAVAAALGVVESGRVADTYNLANTAPNIIYELILGGVLTSVFVPVFVQLLNEEGRERAWQVASAMINLSIVVLTAVATIGILAAPLLAKAYAIRAGEQQALQQDALTLLLRLFIPQIIFYGLYAVTSGLLNAHKRFGAPMYTPVLNNLAVIAVFIAFHQAYGHIDNGLRGITTSQLVFIGLGTTLGVVLQGIAQIPFLRGLGRYRWTLAIAHPSVKKLAKLSTFVIGYVAINQLGYVVVQWLANGTHGDYSAYVSAFTFYMLPHGLFAVSVITALLPSMSEHALTRDWTLFRDRLGTGIAVTVLLVLPAAVGYFVLAEPIIRVLLEHGVMTARSVELVADVLRAFVVGLVFFSLFQLFLRAFYALQDTKTPFLINCASVGFNVALNFPLYAAFGVVGLAAGHAAAYTLGAALQARALSRRIGGLGLRALAGRLARVAAASGAMGLLVWAVSTAIRGLGHAGLGAQLAQVLVPVVVGVVSYVVLATVFGVREMGVVRDLLVRRFSPTKS